MNRDLLVRGAERLGLMLSNEDVERFRRYFELLRQWGERMNLTAVHDPDAVVRNHFLDSLALAASLGTLEPGATMVDVGSGAGFPGFVCAMVRPELRLTAVERVQKKSAFLMSLRRELGLNVEVIAKDVQALSREFDLVVSRAAFPPDEWLRVGGPLVHPHGSLFWMLSARQEAPEIPPLFRLIDARAYDVGEASRHILRWSRVA